MKYYECSECHRQFEEDDLVFVETISDDYHTYEIEFISEYCPICKHDVHQCEQDGVKFGVEIK